MTVPKSAPTPAVKPIARAPQKVTRIAPATGDAPPMRAATPPSRPRKSSELRNDNWDDPGDWRNDRDQKRERGPDRKRCCGSPRGLKRTGFECLGKAEFVARVCAQSVVNHQLPGDLDGQRGRKTALHIDRSQFCVFADCILGQFLTLEIHIRLLRVSLGAD